VNRHCEQCEAIQPLVPLDFFALLAVTGTDERRFAPMLDKRFRAILAALVLTTVTPAQAAPADDLAVVMTDHWRWMLSVNPVLASTLGERSGDGRLGDLSLAAADRDAETAQGFVARLDAIPDDALNTGQRANKAVLRRLLAEQVEAATFGQRTMLFTTYAGWHQQFASLGDYSPFANKADYQSYLDRLAAYPSYNQEAMAITRLALKQGQIQPCEAMGGFENTIEGAVAGPPEKTRLYEPLTRARPRDVTDGEWAAMQARAVGLIRETVAREYRAFHRLYVSEYKPKCRRTIAAGALPQGKAWYASQVRSHTTTNLSPDEIHAIGLKEVARIRARMEAVTRSAGFATRELFVADLRTNPKYYAKTPDELLAAAARTAKSIDGMMPRYFGRLPRLPYGLKTIPAETAETTTSAFYSPGSPESGIAGHYYVNTSKLDQRPLYELPALTAHEAVPGHHQQIALQQELDLPPVRRHVAGFTAFVEGWALYTEFLGEEMGLYPTPETMMGRLSMEMWRACRLVVDTGMHAKGWSKAQAIAFMTDNSALSAANIEAEVNRYISWPGQALGYKLGEIRIRELRSKAEAALGPKFDLKRFHDAVLEQGPVPLDVLEAQIEAWVKAGG
jgi:uncharacterized protein (DUF885 family)